jgi:hypothetical protein
VTEHLEQEPDLGSTKQLLLMGAAASVLAVALSGWAVFMVWLGTGEIAQDHPPKPRDAAREDPAVEHDLFDRGAPALGDIAQARETLHSYGWIDRPAGVVRIPIERAMAIETRLSTQAEESP